MREREGCCCRKPLIKSLNNIKYERKPNRKTKRNKTQRKERRQIRRSAHRYHNNNKNKKNNARASSAEKEIECNSQAYPVVHLDTSCVCSRRVELRSGVCLDPVNIGLMQRALKLYLVLLYFFRHFQHFFSILPFPPELPPTTPGIVVA